MDAMNHQATTPLEALLCCTIHVLVVLGIALESISLGSKFRLGMKRHNFN